MLTLTSTPPSAPTAEHETLRLTIKYRTLAEELRHLLTDVVRPILVARGVPALEPWFVDTLFARVDGGAGAGPGWSATFFARGTVDVPDVELGDLRRWSESLALDEPAFRTVVEAWEEAIEVHLPSASSTRGCHVLLTSFRFDSPCRPWTDSSRRQMVRLICTGARCRSPSTSLCVRYVRHPSAIPSPRRLTRPSVPSLRRSSLPSALPSRRPDRSRSANRSRARCRSTARRAGPAAARARSTASGWDTSSAPTPATGSCRAARRGRSSSRCADYLSLLALGGVLAG